MPRRKRYDEPGAVQHVYNRGVNKCFVFRDEIDRRRYLDLLGWVVRDFKWDCLAYCLMGTHLHLVVRTREANLGRGMHRLHTYYATHFNMRHGRVGHLFQNRYGSSRLWTPELVRYVIEYVDMNPVAAGLAPTPQDWPWGSAAAKESGDKPRWLATRHTLAEIYAELAASS